MRLLKASDKPPKASCCAGGEEGGGGEDMPPKDGCLLCGKACGRGCDCCCGFGADAYSDKIDCLRSGLEGVDETKGLDAALDGRPFEGWELPKKSNPSKESPGLFCFGGCETDLTCGLEGMSVVLGRTGGETGASSPKRSIAGAGAFL